jgi:hypothetical protein
LRTKRFIARGSLAAGVVGLGLTAMLLGVHGPVAAVVARNDQTTCHETTVVTVRGMGEGWSDSGDGFLSPFVDGIQSSDVNAISLQYPNDGLGGMHEGAGILARLLDDVQSSCPNTKLVLAGWSLGGGVIAEALRNSKPSILAAAVTFGSVQFNGALPSGPPFRAFCADGDDVCGGNGTKGPGGHGSYMGEPFLSDALSHVNSRLGSGVPISNPISNPWSSPGSSPISNPWPSPGSSPIPNPWPNPIPNPWPSPGPNPWPSPGSSPDPNPGPNPWPNPGSSPGPSPSSRPGA